MSEQFSILIDSRTRFETGEPGGVWLSMPTTKEQLHEAMQRVGITADNPQDFFINGFMNTEQQPFDVPLPVIQRASVDELNYLGNLLSMQRDEDRDKFTAAVTLGERAGNIKDLPPAQRTVSDERLNCSPFGELATRYIQTQCLPFHRSSRKRTQAFSRPSYRDFGYSPGLSLTCF